MGERESFDDKRRKEDHMIGVDLPVGEMKAEPNDRNEEAHEGGGEPCIPNGHRSPPHEEEIEDKALHTRESASGQRLDDRWPIGIPARKQTLNQGNPLNRIAEDLEKDESYVEGCRGNEDRNEGIMELKEGKVQRAIRGVVQGLVKIHTKRKPCGIVLGERLDWIWTARLLGYQPQIVLTRYRETDKYYALVKELLPDAEITCIRDVRDLREVPTWFVDGFVDPVLWKYLGLVASIIMTTKQGRHGTFGGVWSQRRAKVAHADVGGVTDGFDTCFLWTKDSVARPREDVSVPPLPRRDIYSVASDVVGGAKALPPDEVRLRHPEVTRLGHGFHGGGLYPLGTHDPSFRLRCVYHYTKWCQRRLTWGELGSVYDIPLDVVSQLGGGNRIRQLCVHPSKGLEHCARALLAHAGIAVTGIMETTVHEEHNSLAARMPNIGDIVGKKRTIQPREGLPAALRSQCKKPFQEGEDIGASTAATRATIQLAVADQEKDRNAKATKSDDAAVPVWLWNNAVLEGLSTSPYDRGYKPSDVEVALDRLRDWGLRFFKRNLIKSFCVYSGEQREQGFTTRKAAIKLDARYHGVHPAPKTMWSNSPARFDPKFTPVSRYKWTQHGVKEYRVWWREHWGGRSDDIVPAMDAIVRGAESSWWEWEIGSAPFFWRWPPEYINTIRDGLDVWMPGKAPRFLRPQRPVKEEKIRKLVVGKLEKVRKRKYIEPQRVVSLTDFFHVQKGDDDIRMVYNGTSSGLNDALWVPSFPLPTVDAHLRCVHPSSWMADTDLGEMFLNFHLHKKLRELAGVDLTHYQTDGEKSTDGRPFKAVWEAWSRCAMGLKPSPYQTTQGMQYVEDVARGDRHDKDNIFRWDRVVLNLPGRADYDPSKPWVYKVKEDGTPSNEFLFYVDDNRTVGGSKTEAWLAARRVASTCTFLGIQDAPRKRREPSKAPGAWAGAMVSADENGVYVATSQEKWDKAKQMITDMQEKVQAHPEALDRKDLERKRGFLLYVTRSYPATVPYLKGLHLTIDGWRGGRNSEGWRFLAKEVREAQENGEEGDPVDDGLVPETVKALPRLIDDLEALSRLFRHSSPPLRQIRARKIIEVYYGFGDASQDGFGFTIQNQNGEIVHFRFGQWSTETREASSNYRELINFVDTLERLVREEGMYGAEVFLFTDNSTAESVYYKGNSSSRTLFEQVVRLRQLEMEGDLIVHVIHVAGTRMQAEGADGASRGDASTGVLSGVNMLEYIPLHLGALEAAPGLIQWFNGWWDKGRGPLRIMEPNDWFERPFRGGNCLWAPAPAAAEAAVEQLGRIIHQHPYSCHMFVVPTLLTSRWRRKIGKLMDFECVIRAGTLRGSSVTPHLWKNWTGTCAKCTRPIRCHEGVFCANFSSPRGNWRACRKAWCGDCYTVPRDSPFPIKLATDDEGFDQTLAGDEARFRMARNGDNIMCMFQCELCHFRNIQGRDPVPGRPQDNLLLMCCVRASLDAFWAREPSTVRSNLRGAQRMEAIGSTAGMRGVGPPLGPFPVEDTCGMGVAVCILLRSLDPGKTSDLIQFSTARGIRSVYSNFYHASAQSEDGLAVMAHQTTKIWETECPTYGYWFERLMKGMHKRMGEEVRSDFALSVKVLHKCLGHLNTEYEKTTTPTMRKDIVEIAMFFIASFCLGLRGEEVVKWDIAGFIIYFAAGRDHPQHPHVMIPLVGRFKGETGERWHLLPIVWRTRSGISVGSWATRMMASLQERNRTNGFVYSTPRGKQAKVSTLEPKFFEVLNWVRYRFPDLFPPNVDIENDFGVGRSGRRGASTETANQKVPTEIVEMICRWRKVERAGGRAPNLGMREHYMEVSQALETYLQFSRPL